MPAVDVSRTPDAAHLLTQSGAHVQECNNSKCACRSAAWHLDCVEGVYTKLVAKTSASRTRQSHENSIKHHNFAGARRLASWLPRCAAVPGWPQSERLSLPYACERSADSDFPCLAQVSHA